MNDRFGLERSFLKANWDKVTGTESDQAKGVPAPLQEAPPAPDADIIPLPDVAAATTTAATAAATATPTTVTATGGGGNGENAAESFARLLLTRKSRRKFSGQALSLAEVAYLAWSCEGVRENKGKFSFRTVPSGGARHPLDLYLYAHNVEGLPVGLYRYLPVEHALVLERPGDDSRELDRAIRGQFWDAACVFLWAAVPYRSEWRYGKAAQKLVAIDAGLSCENLYLACEALGFGTCAIGAYDQDRLDAWLGLDGEDMFALLAAPVGKPL